VRAPEEAEVRIAGDFNGWRPEALDQSKLNTKQGWCKSFSLKPGAYEYKYLINGEWILDAGNKNTVDDKFGGENSVVYV
jgi:1,4-alpha-glucan branching enzyme